MARTFRATIVLGAREQARIAISAEVVEELGLRPGESLKAALRGTEFTGKIAGSLKSPGLVVPEDVVKSLGLRQGQGVRLTIFGRAG